MGKQIAEYSCFDNYTVYTVSCSKNVSCIVDKLIRLAVKITENFGGDVAYLINDYRECAEKNQDFSKIVALRESGVDWRDYSEENAEELYRNGYLQFWHLSFHSSTSSGKLIRISISP